MQEKEKSHLMGFLAIASLPQMDDKRETMTT